MKVEVKVDSRLILSFYASVTVASTNLEFGTRMLIMVMFISAFICPHYSSSERHGGAGKFGIDVIPAKRFPDFMADEHKVGFVNSSMGA